MECSCIDADVDDYAEILEDKIVKSRKQHKCHECGCLINVGDDYRLEKTVYDGRIETHKTCTDCNSVRNHLVCSFYWGEIWELVRDSLSDYGDQQPWAKIGRLTPTARDRVCEIIESMWMDKGEED